jgi:hypothetical protein
MQKTGDYGRFRGYDGRIPKSVPFTKFLKQFYIYLSIEEIQESEIEPGHYS